jgi:predicted RNA binding protein YcfA (HicA-like mRNA interferase family)
MGGKGKMSNQKKLIHKLKSRPKDLKWKELVSVCQSLGFQEIQGSGSRVKFFHQGLDFVICVHKPHPSNIVKEYVIKQIVNAFEDRGII